MKDKGKAICTKSVITFMDLSLSNFIKSFAKFYNAKLYGPAPKKEEIVIPFVSTH